MTEVARAYRVSGSEADVSVRQYLKTRGRPADPSMVRLVSKEANRQGRAKSQGSATEALLDVLEGVKIEHRSSLLGDLYQAMRYELAARPEEYAAAQREQTEIARTGDCDCSVCGANGLTSG